MKLRKCRRGGRGGLRKKEVGDKCTDEGSDSRERQGPVPVLAAGLVLQSS